MSIKYSVRVELEGNAIEYSDVVRADVADNNNLVIQLSDGFGVCFAGGRRVMYSITTSGESDKDVQTN